MNNNASETQNNANHITQQSYSVIRISFIQLQRISLEQRQKNSKSNEHKCFAEHYTQIYTH